MSDLYPVLGNLRETLDGLIVVGPAEVVLTGADETDGDWRVWFGDKKS